MFKIREIVGFEDYYINEEGRIFNKKMQELKGKWVDNTGYYQIVLRKNKKRKHVRIHRLVALTFIPNPDNLPQVNHKDGNKLNNNIDNLEWCTNSENTQHGYDANLYHSKRRKIKVKATHKGTKEVFIFSSIRECSEKLSLNRKTISAILFDNKTNNYDYIFEAIL